MPCYLVDSPDFWVSSLNLIPELHEAISLGWRPKVYKRGDIDWVEPSTKRPIVVLKNNVLSVAHFNSVAWSINGITFNDNNIQAYASFPVIPPKDRQILILSNGVWYHSIFANREFWCGGYSITYKDIQDWIDLPYCFNDLSNSFGFVHDCQYLLRIESDSKRITWIHCVFRIKQNSLASEYIEKRNGLVFSNEMMKQIVGWIPLPQEQIH